MKFGEKKRRALTLLILLSVLVTASADASLVNYPSLFSSMQSGTPGCRFHTGHYRTHRMACALIERIGTTQNFIILGAMFQIQGIHPSPR